MLEDRGTKGADFISEDAPDHIASRLIANIHFDKFGLGCACVYEGKRFLAGDRLE